ncbi:DNA-binding protein [Klebsiella michiganensis]|nr:DNA-binding protein [Klebsiella michiganensis]
MDNGITIEHYINNQEEAEKKCIEKNRFSRKLKNRIDNISSEETRSAKNNLKPK